MLSTTDSILVTGGVGFVGSALVGELLEATGATRITVLDKFFNDGANAADPVGTYRIY